MEYDSLRTFRARLKEALDYVEAGSEEGDLIIHRGDTVFKLVLENWRVEDELPEVIQPTKDTCKNGHTIPLGRDRCLFKGCKYS